MAGTVRVRAVIEVWEMSVEVNVIGVVTGCATHAVVAAVIGAVRVGVGTDEDIQIVHQKLDFVIV